MISEDFLSESEGNKDLNYYDLIKRTMAREDWIEDLWCFVPPLMLKAASTTTVV